MTDTLHKDPKGRNYRLPSGNMFWVAKGHRHYPEDGRCRCLACVDCPGDATRYLIAHGQQLWICEECVDAVMVAYCVGEGPIHGWGKTDPLLSRAFGPLPKAGAM